MVTSLLRTAPENCRRIFSLFVPIVKNVPETNRYRVLHHTVYKVTALLRKNEMYGIKFETNFIITIDEEFN